MQISLIGHASILVESNGIRIISDPWWRGPCYGAQWWNYPVPRTDLVDESATQYIYISHGHNDHYHPGTLSTFDRNSRVVVPAAFDLAPGIAETGFEVIELAPDEPLEMGEDFRCWIWPTYGADSLMIIEDGREVCVNINDALHSAPREVQDRFIHRLRERFGRVDYVFCGYGVASHFPNCYLVPGKDNAGTAARRQAWFNGQWARIIHELNPVYGFPFAADVVLYEDDLFFANEPTHNRQRPTDRFLEEYPESDVRVIDIAPGFQVGEGTVKHEVLREPLAPESLRQNDADRIDRANRYGSVGVDAVTEVVNLLNRNVDTSIAYFREFRGDYRFGIRFRGSDMGVAISKRGDRISIEAVADWTVSPGHFDLIYRARLPYLKLSLTEPYGHEILFVGSGGVFAYQSRAGIKSRFHQELRTMMVRHDEPVCSRFGSSGRWVFRLKQYIKWLLGKRELRLYELEEWIVFETAGGGEIASGR